MSKSLIILYFHFNVKFINNVCSRVWRKMSNECFIARVPFLIWYLFLFESLFFIYFKTCYHNTWWFKTFWFCYRWNKWKTVRFYLPWERFVDMYCIFFTILLMFTICCLHCCKILHNVNLHVEKRRCFFFLLRR